MGWSRRTAFVGREGELALFDDAAAAARSGTPQIVLVEGEAGIGKTRLVAEAIARNQHEHDVVVACHGVALTGDQLAFGGVVELVRNVAAARPEELRLGLPVGGRRLLEAWDEHGSGFVGRLDRVEMFEGFLGLVEHLGGSHLVWIAVDDIQWLDASTCDLLVYVARALQDAQLMITCTVRTTELPTIWRGPAAGLRRSLNAQTIVLDPLDAGHTGEQVTDLLGRPASPALLDRVAHLGQGIPFLTEELIAGGLRESGPLPSSARDLMLGRVATLPYEAHRAVEAASVEDRPVSHDDLCRVLGLSAVELDAAADAALTTHLWDEAGNDRYKFHHALLKEAVTESLRPGRRRDLHRRWGELFAEQAPTLASSISAAHHWTESGDLGLAFDATLAAAEMREAKEAPVEQGPLWERLLDLWESVPEPECRSGRDRDTVARNAILLSVRVGDFPSACRLLQAELARPDSAQDVTRWIGLNTVLQSAREHLNEPQVHLDAAEEWARTLISDGSGPWLSSGCVELAWRLDGHKHRDLALALTERALVGDRAKDAETVIEVARRRARLFLSMGRQVDALNEIEAVLGQAEHEMPERFAGVLAYRAQHRHLSGDLTGAVESARRSLELMPHPHVTPRQYADGVHALCRALLDLGRWTEIDPYLDEARRLHSVGRRSVDLDLDATLVAAYRGHIDVAEELAHAAWLRFSEGVETSDVELLVRQGSARLASAVVAANQRDVGRVRDMLRPVLESILAGAASDVFSWHVPLVVTGAEAAHAHAATRRSGRSGPEERESMLELALAAAAPTCPPGPVGAAVQAQLHVDVLRSKAEDRIGDWQRAADRWRAAGIPHDEGWARLRLAERLVAEGHRQDAATAAQCAADIAERLGARPLLDDAHALSRRARLGVGRMADEADDSLAVLTAREREVLELVAQGRSNDQIADRLFISPKTASVHVSHILAKLGVSSRTEAAAHWHQARADASN